MANLAGFDATQQAAMQSFEAMAAHKGLMMIVASQMKPTKAGTGSFLECELNEIGDGVYKGRKLWVRMNLSNPNKTAEEIANRELGAICKAVGILKPTDSAELHNRPMMVDVGVKKNDRNEDENYVKGYEPIGGMQASAPAPAPAPASGVAPAAVAPPAAPPWATKQ